MVGITGDDPRILILDGLTPFRVSVRRVCVLCVFGLRLSSAMCQFVPGHFVLVSSVRPSGVPSGG